MPQSVPHSLFIGVAKPGGFRGWYISDLQLINQMPELSWNWTSTLGAISHISRVDRQIDMQWSEESVGMRYTTQALVMHVCSRHYYHLPAEAAL